MSSIKVCHLGKFYPPAHGGIETHVRLLAQAQAERGIEAEVICMNHERGPTAVEHDGAVKVTRFGRVASAAKLDYCPDLSAALAAHDADLFHVQVPNPTMLLALLSARPKKPIVVGYQSDAVRQKLRRVLFRPVERLVYRNVAAILPSSPHYAGGSKLLARYAERIRVLPLGIDLEPYANPAPKHWEEAERIRAEHRGPLWLGCGRLVYYKGFVNAVRALTRAPGDLILIGKGPELPSLEAEARKLGVADRLRFVGGLPQVHDIIPYYLAADAFWFPSNERSEAFGLVQVEAMACGLPVINAEIPHSGVSWVSRHDESGLTVPINNPGALADAANRLISEPGLRDRLSKGARARAAAEFDHRVMAARSIEIYREALAANRPSAHPLRAKTGEPPVRETAPPPPHSLLPAGS